MSADDLDTLDDCETEDDEQHCRHCDALVSDDGYAIGATCCFFCKAD